jgi:hypothetical protein
MNIKPSTAAPEKLFTGIATCYQVPHYQRDSAWTNDNCEEFWNDVMTAFYKATPDFLGRIVLNAESDRASEQGDIVCQAIDGTSPSVRVPVLATSPRMMVPFESERSFLEGPFQIVFEANRRGLRIKALLLLPPESMLRTLQSTVGD